MLLEDEELPLVLPELEDYKGHNGKAPLENAEEWKHYVTKDGKKGLRETSTMPGSAGSSWYFLRYIDPNNEETFCDKKLAEHWLPVDLYMGGPEHAVGHLMYSRIWNNYLYDKGLSPVKEPFKKLVHQGMILGENGIKMGKRYPEFAIDPKDIARDYGADTLRLYEMFIGDYAKDAAWNENGLKGCRKFLNRVWAIQDKVTDSEEYTKSLESALHKTIKKVTHDIESLDYNTAVSALMILLNEMDKEASITKADYRILLQLLNPFAPHITEELWSKYGTGKMLVYEAWPTYDEAKTIDDTIELPVQMNGKLKGTVMISLDSDEQTVKDKVHSELAELLADKNIVKEIYVKNKIFNIVVK